MGNNQCSSIICQKTTNTQEENPLVEPRVLKNNKNSNSNASGLNSQNFFPDYKHINESQIGEYNEMLNNTYGNRVLMYVKELPIKAYQDKIIYQNNLINFPKKINKDCKDDFKKNFTTRGHNDFDTNIDNQKKLMSKSLENKIKTHNKNVSLNKKDKYSKIKKNLNIQYEKENFFEYRNNKDNIINSDLISMSDRHISNFNKGSSKNKKEQINFESNNRINLKREKYMKNLESNDLLVSSKKEKLDFDTKTLNRLNEINVNENNRYDNLKIENKLFENLKGSITSTLVEDQNIKKETVIFDTLTEKLQSQQSSKVSFAQVLIQKINKNSSSNLMFSNTTQKAKEISSNTIKKMNTQQNEINKFEYEPEMFIGKLKYGRDPLKIEKRIDDKIDFMIDKENSFLKLNYLKINKSDDIIISCPNTTIDEKDKSSMNLDSIRNKKQKMNLDEKSNVDNRNIKLDKNNIKLTKQESKISNLIIGSNNHDKTSNFNSPIKIKQNSIQLNFLSLMSPNKESNLQSNKLEINTKAENKKSYTSARTSSFSKKIEEKLSKKLTWTVNPKIFEDEKIKDFISNPFLNHYN